jgi:Domain of unknown function (DUF4062)
MKTRPTIFISGVSQEFGSFRDAVENEIEMKGCFAENQPDFHPDYSTVEEMLRRRLHDSDAVIHIVGFRFGAEPNQRPANAPRRSYTQMEFDIARELQKPVYIFLSADATVRQPPNPDEQPEDDDAEALQRAHRAAVQKTNHLYYFFKAQADLCKLVAQIPPVHAASFLELLLGEVAGAVQDAEQSVTHAGQSGDALERIFGLTVLATALHQAGRRKEAEARFQEAEQLQADCQPAYPLLYSLQGFLYCDLLLTEVERAAWQRFVVLFLGGQWPFVPEPCKCMTTNEALAANCRAVSERAAQTLKWEEGIHGPPFLDIPLRHLTLSRATLYEALLEHSEIENSQSEIDAAMSGLRHAGQQQYLPLVLLTRAWLRSMTGARIGPESAQSDLDEAWEIAERGSMKLYMADIHLYRARLFFFFPEQQYPWQSPQDDLAAAEKLINDCGYHRRDGEIADAKQAILGQSLR